MHRHDESWKPIRKCKKECSVKRAEVGVGGGGWKKRKKKAVECEKENKGRQASSEEQNKGREGGKAT